LNRVGIYPVQKGLYADERGWAAFPFQAGLERTPLGIDLSSLHAVMTEPGGVRGNHRHPESAEWLYVHGGVFDLYWEEDGRPCSASLQGPHLIHVPADTAHTLRNTGPAPLFLVAFRETAVGEPHTVGAPLV